MKAQITQVVDEPSLHFARQILARYCNGPHMLHVELLCHKKWHVVPMASGLHIDESLARVIETASTDQSAQSAYAIETEGLRVPFCFDVPLSYDGLVHFNYECGGFNYLIVPRNEAFCILCTTRDYLLFAAPTDFLKSIFPSGIEKAINSFESYINDQETWTSGEIAAFKRALDLHYEVEAKLK